MGVFPRDIEMYENGITHTPIHTWSTELRLFGQPRGISCRRFYPTRKQFAIDWRQVEQNILKLIMARSGAWPQVLKSSIDHKSAWLSS